MTEMGRGMLEFPHTVFWQQQIQQQCPILKMPEPFLCDSTLAGMQLLVGSMAFSQLSSEMLPQYGQERIK